MMFGVSDVIGLLNTCDPANLVSMIDNFEDIKGAIQKNSLLQIRNLNIMMDLSARVVDSNFIGLSSEFAGDSLTHAVNNMQSSVGAATEALRATESYLKNFYDKFNLSSTDPAADIPELNSYLASKSSLSEQSGIISHVVRHSEDIQKSVSSAGISFVDRVETLMQRAIDDLNISLKLVENIDNVKKIAMAAMRVWSEICHQNKHELEDLLRANYDFIESKISKVIGVV